MAALLDVEYCPTNREKSLAPKTGKGWCDHCDRAIVGHGEKCPICRRKNGTRTLRAINGYKTWQ